MINKLHDINIWKNEELLHFSYTLLHIPITYHTEDNVYDKWFRRYIIILYCLHHVHNIVVLSKLITNYAQGNTNIILFSLSYSLSNYMCYYMCITMKLLKKLCYNGI